MNLIAQAVLSRQSGVNERISTVHVVALDTASHSNFDFDARHVVTLQITQLKQGVAQQVDESTLTPMPVSLEKARQRALAYLRQRLAAGEVLQSQSGFEGELTQATAQAEMVDAVLAPFAPSMPSVQPRLPESALQTGALSVLLAKLQNSRWRVLNSGQRARLIWRLAEYADPQRSGGAQKQLRAEVPQLIGLLETDDDLLDYCLAYLIGRLGDPGAAVAMQALSERGRSPATKDLARQAWLALLPGTEREAALAEHRQWWSQLPQVEQELSVKRLPAGLDSKALLRADELGCFAAEVSEVVRSLVASVPFEKPWWSVIRRIYKRAEWRRDHAMLAALHARFDGERESSRSVGRETLHYMRLRGWRDLRRTAEVEHSHAPELASAMLTLMDEDCAEVSASQGTHMPEREWLLAGKLLVPHAPQVRLSSRGLGWHAPSGLALEQLPAQRVDGLQAMWNASPQHLLKLVSKAQSTVLLWSLTRALQDQSVYLDQLDVPQVEPLLHKSYAPTAALGLEVVQKRLATLRDMQDMRPWLLALAQCPDGPAATYLSAMLSKDRSAAAADAELVAALLLSPSATTRTQGVALLSFAQGDDVALALLAALPTLDAGELSESRLRELRDVRDSLQSLFAENAPLTRHAASVPAAPLHRLLTHSLTALVEIATAWLLVHPPGLKTLPPAALSVLLGSDEPARVACGVRLMGSLPNDVLWEQAEVLAEYAVSPHVELRKAVIPIIERLAGDARCNARIAERLHDALFRSEPGDGVYDDVLHLLTGSLAAVAPGRDASSVWRALQARATGAQRYGAWALKALGAEAYTLRQWATLARHADVEVRARSRDSIDTRLTPMAQTTPEQAEQLMPLADALFADTQQYARQLLGERLPASALAPELLVAWVDHPQAWVQALGRQRLTTQMTAPEASMCLTRLAQHPATNVQLFVTQWLLNLPDEPAPARAARLEELKPYFLAVLSQVHRARASKTRVLHFLRSQIESQDTAAVVASIFARQVVSASLADQPDYVAGLRDIVARHPALAQTFMQPVTSERRESPRTPVKA